MSYEPKLLVLDFFKYTHIMGSQINGWFQIVTDGYRWLLWSGIQ